MNRHVIIIACLYVAYALPVAENESETLELVQIPLKDGKELDILSLADNNGKLSERNKRTIGILRDLFPELTKQVDDSVNKLVSQIIRVVGPAVLRSAVSNNNNALRSRTSFDADFDDDEDNKTSDNSVATSSGSRVRVELPTFAPDDNDADSLIAEVENITTTKTKAQTSGDSVLGDSSLEPSRYSLNVRFSNNDDNVNKDSGSTAASSSDTTQCSCPSNILVTSENSISNINSDTTTESTITTINVSLENSVTTSSAVNTDNPVTTEISDTTEISQSTHKNDGINLVR